MENVKICEIRNGINSNYPHLISPDEKYLFCCSKKLGDNEVGDKVYCIDRSRNKAFFTVISDEKIEAVYNPTENSWEFKYDHHLFRAKENDIFLKLNVSDKQIIPADWGWRKLLGQNQIYNLWHPQIKKTEERLVKVNDLQLLFREGPAADTLNNCRELLSAHSDALTVEKTKLTLHEPTEQHSDADRLYGRNLMDFNNRYRQVMMACKTVPIVILAGISGIGKSRLPRTLAYITCFEEELQCVDKPGNFELIRVKSDWHDPNSIIGYPLTLSGNLKYQMTAFIRFIVKAWRYRQVPFFLCLDEMNLANADNYFSDFLSIVESMRFHDGQMYSDAFISKEDILLYHSKDASFWLELGLTNEDSLCKQFLSSGITLPPNLTVIGTVNMDETTHAFSRRVLDRAMVIEMSNVDIRKGTDVPLDDWQYPEKSIGAELLTGRLQDFYESYNKNVKTGSRVIDELEEIYDCLDNSPFKLGYRVRDQIIKYCAYNEELVSSKILFDKWFDICFDETIMMKILTRIEGSETKCGNIINALLSITDGRFRESFRKLQQMQRQLDISGYTSFWH